jgi:hypothetical protein
VFPTGGHFAALEEPQALLGEIKKFAANEVGLLGGSCVGLS